jgi:hypothetical protein
MSQSVLERHGRYCLAAQALSVLFYFNLGLNFDCVCFGYQQQPEGRSEGNHVVSAGVQLCKIDAGAGRPTGVHRKLVCSLQVLELRLHVDSYS